MRHFIVALFVFIFIPLSALSTEKRKEQAVENSILYMLRDVKHFLKRKPEKLEKYSKAILLASKNSNVDWQLIVSVAYYESRFNPLAKSHKGARGIMQILGGTVWKYCKLQEKRKLNKKSVEDQFICGAHWLRYSIDKCGNTKGGISRYMTKDVCNPKWGTKLFYRARRRFKTYQELKKMFP